LPIHRSFGYTPVSFDPAGLVVAHGTTRFQLRLLDGFRLEQDGRAVRIPHSARRLIAFLGIRGRSRRAEIAGTLWPDVPEPKAQASLRTVLWRLHGLTADPVVTGREALALATTVDADVQAFIAVAQRTVNDTASAADESSTPVIEATGELLPGWYEDWVLFERERWRQLQMYALEAAAKQLTDAGRYAEAIEAALAAVRLEPLRESATRALIVAHLAENNIIEAVRCLESFRDNLLTELGVRPTPALEQLVQSSLSRQA
jgi:DNA-binding SARP family transcriptional activator